MKQPLLVSYRGSEEVRNNCAPHIEKQLPSIPLQWRRSDGEFPLQVQISVKLVNYAPDLIRKRDSSWQDVAATHIYFLDCVDTERYRLDVRPDLIEWFATLRDADTNDWLVVFDACKAKESKGRSQVVEKLRSDLSKYANRIMEIDSSLQKAPALLRAVADQCLITFDSWVHVFEANLKIERDACFSLEWSFKNYMITQVQYSRLLLSVSLFDQSLAQLDELDAMLSLLIIHYIPAAKKAPWLEDLCTLEAGDEIFSLLSLYTRLGDSISHLISPVEPVDSAHDLRWIRAVIFCCQLSVILNRYADQLVTAEAACQRVMWYGAILVQGVRKEEATLKGVSKCGASECLSNALWCLEVLHFANGLCDLALISNESEATCTLWMTLCRMVQLIDPSETTTIVWDKTSSDDSDSPMFLLEKCLADPAVYEEHFVKWHESALAMLKHCGWRRHARTLGVSLADFYSHRGKVTEALHLYLKLLRQLEDERWCEAYIGLLLSIGDDLLGRCTLRERLKFYGNLACGDRYLPSSSTSMVYYEKFKAEFDTDWTLEPQANSSICPWFHIRSVQPEKKSIFCGCDVQWTVVIENRFPAPMDVSSIALYYSTTSTPPWIQIASDGQQCMKLKKLTDFRRESCSVASDVADCGELSTLVSWNEPEHDRRLEPGMNVVHFQGKCSREGTCIPEHVHVHLGDGRLDIQVRLTTGSLSHCVARSLQSEVVMISPADGEYLWAGVTQTVKFRLKFGTKSPGLEPDEEKDLRLEAANSDLQLTNPDTEDESESTVASVSVPDDWKPGSFLDVEQTVFCNIHGSQDNKICEVTSCWRGHTFSHELHFKPVFHWMSDLKVIGERLLLSITLHNDGKRPLLLREPKLTFSTLGQDQEEIGAELLNSEDVQELNFGSPYTLVWYVPPACSSLGVITFNYQFKDSSMDGYICYADVALQKPAIVEACCQMASEKIVCRVGMTCDFVVSLKALDPALRLADILVALTFDTRFWTCMSNGAELVRLKNNGLGQALFQVVPQCVGFLPMPGVRAQMIGDSATTKACQAYVRSKGKQIHVLAPLAQHGRSSRLSITSFGNR